MCAACTKSSARPAVPRPSSGPAPSACSHHPRADAEGESACGLLGGSWYGAEQVNDLSQDSGASFDRREIVVAEPSWLPGIKFYAPGHRVPAGSERPGATSVPGGGPAAAGSSVTRLV